jgi:general secretion pathway protein G
MMKKMAESEKWKAEGGSPAAARLPRFTFHISHFTFRRSALRRPLSPSTFRRFGFTLVELLAVITIVTMLAALVVGGASFAMRKASVARCYAQMEVIKNALSDYRIDKGRYPQASVERDREKSVLYDPLVKEPVDAGRKPYLVGADFVQHWPKRTTSSDPMKLVDPWGNYYRYRSPGVENQTSFDLWSYGPNGQDDSNNPDKSDDINNWSSGR